MSENLDWKNIDASDADGNNLLKQAEQEIKCLAIILRSKISEHNLLSQKFENQIISVTKIGALGNALETFVTTNDRTFQAKEESSALIPFDSKRLSTISVKQSLRSIKDEKFENLNENLNAIVKEKNEIIQKLYQKISKGEDKIQSLEQDLSANLSTIEKLEAKVGEIDKDSQIMSLKSDLIEDNAKISDNQEDLNHSIQELKRLKLKLEHNKKTIDKEKYSSSSDLQQLKEQNSNLLQEVQNISLAYHEAVNMKSRAVDDCYYLRNQLSEMSKNCARMELELFDKEDIRNCFKAAQKEIKELNGTIADCNQKLKSADKEIARLNMPSQSALSCQNSGINPFEMEMKTGSKVSKIDNFWIEDINTALREKDILLQEKETHIEQLNRFIKEMRLNKTKKRSHHSIT